MEVRTQQSGRLEDVSPLDLLQSLGIYRRAGHVLFFHPYGRSQVWFEAGEIVDAESGALRGAAAVHRVATHLRGEFRVEITGEARARTIECSSAALILEAARRLDEGQLVRARLPATEAVLAVAAADGVAATEGEARVAALFDGGASVGEVLERSPLGELETLQQVAALVDAGRLAPTGEVREPTVGAAHGRAPWQLGVEPSGPFVPSPSYLDDADEPPVRRRWRLHASVGAAVAALATLAIVVSLGEASPAVEPLPPVVIDATAYVPASEPDAPREPTLTVAASASAAARPASDDRVGLAASPSPAATSASSTKGARTADPRSRSRAPTEPEPAVQPTSSRSEPPGKPEEAASLLAQARRAYAAGQGEKAYHLASRSLWLRPTGDAAEVMALSACQQGRSDAALEALRTVPLLRRASVRSKCKQAHGVRLKLGATGR